MRADEGFAAIVELVGSKPSSLCECCGQAMVGIRRSTYGLTKRQAQALNYIRDYVAEHKGASPKYDAIADALGLKSKSSIHRIVNALEERGFIHRLPNRKRSILALIGAT